MLFFLTVFIAATPFFASASPAWIRLQPTGGAPPSRRYHSSVYDPSSNRLIIFGGCLAGTCQSVTQSTNELWVMTNANGVGTSTWIQLAATGGPPPARFLHAAVYDAAHNRMTIWGGDSAFVSAPNLKDVWVLENANGLGGTPTWTQLFPTGGPPPGGSFGGREFTSAVYDPITNRMISFGGASCDPCEGRDDVWVLTNANGLGGPPAWVQLFPTGGPPPSHYAHSAVFDAAGNRMVIFGGIVPGGIGADAWVLANASGIDRTTGLPAAPAWTQLPGGPEPRQFHAAAYDAANNRMVVFGGFGDSGYRNDVWLLDNANGTGPGMPAWSVETAGGSPPEPRAVFYHYQLFDPVSRRLLVFGGDPDTAGPALNDSWVLTEATGAPTSSAWIELHPTGGPPPPRRLHSTVYDPVSNRLIVFGGCTPVGNNACVSGGGIVRNDVWVLTNANGLGDPSTWIELLPTGGPPPARQNHVAVYDQANNRMIMWGGEPTLSWPTFTDVWVLTNANGLDRATGMPATPGWIQLFPLGTFPPSGVSQPGREGSASIYDSVTNRMILFGGGVCDPCDQRNDVWVLTEANGLGATPQWLQLFPSGGPPGPRAEHSLTYDVNNDRMIVFGGGYPTVNDTWVLSDASGLSRATGLPATPVWTPLTPGSAPPVRSNHAAAFDAGTNRQVIFGGRGADTSTALGDVWLLENANGTGASSTWTQTLPSGTAPDPRWVFQHFQIYDSASNRMIVFGGDPGATTTLFSDVWVLTDAVGPPLVGDALGVDVHGSGGSSNLNGVLEPGESAVVEPAWSNRSASLVSLTGIASLFQGPPGTYTIADGAADYGAIAGGTVNDCFAVLQDCYELGVSGPRPVQHWDATFEETLSWTSTKTWTLHIGESFGDVPTSNLFYGDIENIFHNLITIGCSDTEYCPADPTLRKQMAVFVLKAKEGAAYEPPPATGVFSDVPVDDPFAPWIEELFRRGVVEGCAAPGGFKQYCPNDPVLRQQMPLFLLLTLEGPGYVPPACSGIFTDVGCPGMFADWIEDLAARAITVGCGDDIYCPKSATTRGQMAAFVVNTFGLALYGP